MVSAVHQGFLGVDDYLAIPRGKETWLVKPIIPVSGAALLYGESKLGKSFLAIQLALAITGQSDNWLGFPVLKTGVCCYLQLDTPGNVWAMRFHDMIHKHGLKYDSNLLKLGDRETINRFPFDVLQPAHMNAIKEMIQIHNPVAVIIDTLRESHSGDEDSSTTSRNVIANLVGATHPAALIIVSHSRKPHPDVSKDLMSDVRGSSYIPGRMDVIMRLTRGKLYYSGRSIEEGNIKLQRLDSGLWMPAEDDTGPALEKVMADPALKSMRARARALAVLLGATEEACMSRLRRTMTAQEHLESKKCDTKVDTLVTPLKSTS
jgi:hypothetical protein